MAGGMLALELPDQPQNFVPRCMIPLEIPVPKWMLWGASQFPTTDGRSYVGALGCWSIAKFPGDAREFRGGCQLLDLPTAVSC